MLPPVLGIRLLLATLGAVALGGLLRLWGKLRHQAGAVRDHGVTLALSSDAARVDGFPAELSIRLRAADGRSYAPLDRLLEQPLRAGDRRVEVLHFPTEAQLAGASLVVTWKPGLGYPVPGAGNPLVQGRTRLALPPPS